MNTIPTDDTTNPGDGVMKAIGGLDAATTALKAQVGSQTGFSEDDAVSIFTIIGRVLLGIFGK